MGRKRNRDKVTAFKRKRKGRETVFVAVPTINNRLTVAVHDFLMSLALTASDPSCPFQFIFKTVNGLSPVEYARNRLVGEFLKTHADRLWFIDDDMLPKESAAKLLHVDADIAVAKMCRFDHSNKNTGLSAGVALCAMMKSTVTPGKYHAIAPQPGDRLIQDIDAGGTGAMLIRRKVLTDPRIQLSGDYIGLAGKECTVSTNKEDHDYAPPVFRFQRSPSGQPILGEDLDFCERAKDLGYSIKVHLGASFGHYKQVDLDEVVDMAGDAIKLALESTKGAS